ncbi:MAG: DUF1853 family protein [Pseudomonas sp.]
MDKHAGPPAPTSFRVPAVRHLCWMCQAEQLLDDRLCFAPSAYLNAEVWERLRAWDQHPELGPRVLTEPAHRRLGLYFEQLYACLMRDLLGWQILAQNLPVRSQGRTLGELDLVLRNPLSGEIEHHEVAVKFYLGYRPDQQTEMLWYGPNPSDRLDLKVARMREQQSQRGQLQEARSALAAAGIDRLDRARVFMPGYLFQPVSSQSPPEGPHWMYLQQADLLPREHWVVLRKPHWLGPWVQDQPPQSCEVDLAMEQVRLSATPRLFALLGWSANANAWVETSRCFVVPPHWPAREPAVSLDL